MAVFGRLSDGHAETRVLAELERRRSDIGGIAFKLLLQFGLLLALLVLAVLLVDVARDGWSVLSTRLGDFLGGTLRSRSIDERLGVHQGLVGSFWIAVFTAVFSFPLGIGAAVYLEEYAPKTRVTRFIELNIRNLAGVPSVVYGLLGLGIFVKTLGGLTGGRSLLSAGITLAVLVGKLYAAKYSRTRLLGFLPVLYWPCRVPSVRRHR